MQITTLIDNRPSPDDPELTAEWGLSLCVELNGRHPTITCNRRRHNRHCLIGHNQFPRTCELVVSGSRSASWRTRPEHRYVSPSLLH